jgi:hypothetical protein
MADEKKQNDVVSEQDGKGNETQAQPENKEAVKDDKKQESGISKWWKGTKAKVNADLLESRIENAYTNAHQSFDVYDYGSALFNGGSVNGEIVDGALLYWGTQAIKEYAVVVDKKDNKAYYALTSEPIDVKANYEGVEYTRKGTKTMLDPKVVEVKVVKADKRYFLYQGKADEKK